MLRTLLLKTYLLNCCLPLMGLYVFPIFATWLYDLCFLELCNVFVFCFLCVARTITPTPTCGWRGTEGKWGGGRYSFKKMEEHALEGHSETGQLKTVPFCCLFFPCQYRFLPRYFTLCLSQNSLSIGWTTNGVSNSCTTVYASLWCVARQTLRLLHFLSIFSPVTFAVFEADKSSSKMKKAGSAPLDQLVSFFFFCGKGVLRFLAVQPHTCEQVKGMGEYT